MDAGQAPAAALLLHRRLSFSVLPGAWCPDSVKCQPEHDGASSGQRSSLCVFSLQVWDDELERSATHWAERCQWDHGPQDLLRSIGQNLAVHWGR